MQKRHFTEQEVEKLEKHIIKHSLRDATIFRVGLDSNLSLRDLLSLKISDVIGPMGYLKEVLQIKKKRGADIEVMLSEKSLDLLDHYIDQLEDENVYLFLGKNKKRGHISNSHWNHLIKKYSSELGIESENINKPAPCETKLDLTYDMTGSLQTIQRLLNPKNLSITLAYKHQLKLSLKSLISY